MWRFLIPTILLAAFGIFSLMGTKPDLVLNQLIYLGIASGVYFAIRFIGTHFFRVNAVFIYIAFVILLILTLFIAEEINGSRRWIDLYFFNFQTSEFFKIFYIILLADFLSKNQRWLNEFRSFVILLITLAVPAALIVMQPDLETALFLIGIFFVIAFFTEIPKKALFSLLGIGVMALPVAWFFLAEYQKNRILSFINPQLDPQGTAYNMAQSIITVGSGQFFGRGLGLGKQSTLFFLPENHTDFAYASLVEQFGFVGGVVVILLFGILAVLLVRKLLKHMNRKEEHHRFQFYYTLGFFIYFLFQVCINIGMNLGILPISGTALPLISYGGSSLVTWMIGLAFLTDRS